MRNIRTADVTAAIKEMCIEANHFLAPDMREAMERAAKEEVSELGGQILKQLKENMRLAGEEQIPICQDTGMAVVFAEIGQEVHIEGGLFRDAVNEGVRQAYRDGYLRKSVVFDPLARVNSTDNTPAVL